MPSRLIQWWLSVTRGPCGPELVLALDLMAACGVALFLDNWIVDAFSGFHDSLVSLLLTFIPNRVQLGLLFAVGMIYLILYRRASGDNLGADRGMFVLGCGAISGFAADMLKIVFGRPRPDGALADTAFNFHLFGGGDGFDSFPSSHAAIAAGIAAALSAIWPDHRHTFLTLAAVVAASRFVTGVHYLSDALLGFAVGLAIVVATRVLFSQCGIRLHSERARKR
jgi:membrane-associated phospholipid phosphatase